MTAEISSRTRQSNIPFIDDSSGSNNDLEDEEENGLARLRRKLRGILEGWIQIQSSKYSIQ